MDIVGNGFLARNLEPISAAHPRVVVAAAGVSAATGTAEAEFAREAEFVYGLVRRCARQDRKLLFFSTASTGMYSVPGEAGREDGPVFPATPYGRHKLALEGVLAAASIDYLVLRLGHVVGPEQPAHQLLPAMVAQVRSGLVRLHRGAQRDLIDVADVVTIADRLLAIGANRTVVNVASGVPVPIDDIIDHIEARLGLRAVREYVKDAHNQPVSTAKLRRLVPDTAAMGFSEGYYRRVLDRYVAAGSAVSSAAPA